MLAPDGSRSFAVDAPDRVVALSAHSRGFAAVLADGSVLRIGPTGRILGADAVRARLRRSPPCSPRRAWSSRRSTGSRSTGTAPCGGSRCRPDRASSASRKGSSRYGTGPAAAAADGSRTATTSSSGRWRRGSRRSSGGAGIAYASGRTLGFVAWVNVSSSARAARHLDLEEVAVEPVAEDHVVVLDELELVLLVPRERPDLDSLRRHRPDALAAANAFGAVRRLDRRLDRLRERRQRPVGNVLLDEQRPVGKRREVDLVSRAARPARSRPCPTRAAGARRETRPRPEATACRTRPAAR